MKISELIIGGMGYTGLDEDHAVRDWTARWRHALAQDGWTAAPIYRPDNASTKHERDGWHVHIYEQPCAKGWQISIAAWGPDTLAVDLPIEYDWETMQANLRKCDRCGATDVDTQRVGFAGRVCADCLPAARRQSEYPGWTN